jgi:hypothetical protein
VIYVGAFIDLASMDFFRKEVLGENQKPLMEIRISQSKKRRKTVQARESGGVSEILAPAHMSDKQLGPIIENLKKRINRNKKRSKLDNQALERRANTPNRQYFDNLLKWEAMLKRRGIT